MARRTDIEALLQENLLRFDPTLNVTSGSSLYQQVVLPVVNALAPDYLETPVEDLVRDRLKKEYPALALDGGGAVEDLVVKPLRLTLDAAREQILRIRQRQSVQSADLLTEDDADELMSNWFVNRIEGTRSRVTGRVYFSNPTLVAVTPVNRFSTGGGLNFFPTVAQSISALQMATQQEGTAYYVDFDLVAEKEGTAYQISAGSLVSATGLPSYTKVTNPSVASEGLNRESNAALLARARRSLVERSTTNSRGISARLSGAFGGLRNLEVVGYGDPEMRRDLITGGDEGKVYAAGQCFVFGTFILFFSGYEDRGPSENYKVQAGYDIELHYGKLLYGLPAAQRHEAFEIQSVVWDSRDIVPELPSILVLRIGKVPTPTTTVLGGLPGFLPGVSAVVTGPGKITISDVPGGIQGPTTDVGTVVVDDGAVHVGGHHDVWIRPVSDDNSAVTLSVAAEASVYASNTLVSQGAAPPALPNIVSSSDVAVDWNVLGVEPGMYLSILDGVDAGIYAILAVTATELVLDTDLVANAPALTFKIINEVAVDPFDPRKVHVPFGDIAPGTDLETVIGSDVFFLGVNILSVGAGVGDVIRILEGDDAGDYRITAFHSSGGGTTPQVDRPASASNGGLAYEVFTRGTGIQRPLIRVLPSGVALLDSSAQPTDITIPYALPVEARANVTFTGASETCAGYAGFIVPSFGLAFEPTKEACSSDIDRVLEALLGAPLSELDGLTIAALGAPDCDAWWAGTMCPHLDGVYINPPPAGLGLEAAYGPDPCDAAHRIYFEKWHQLTWDFWAGYTDADWLAFWTALLDGTLDPSILFIPLPAEMDPTDPTSTMGLLWTGELDLLTIATGFIVFQEAWTLFTYQSEKAGDGVAIGIVNTAATAAGVPSPFSSPDRECVVNGYEHGYSAGRVLLEALATDPAAPVPSANFNPMSSGTGVGNSPTPAEWSAFTSLYIPASCSDPAEYHTYFGHGFYLGLTYCLIPSLLNINIEAAVAAATLSGSGGGYLVSPIGDPVLLSETVSRLLSRRTMYSDGCLECTGYIICVTIDATGITLAWGIGAEGKEYINAITTWITKVIGSLFPSFTSPSPPLIEVDAAGDLVLKWNHLDASGDPGPNPAFDSVQFEICVPEELIGCCSNLFMAIPDIGSGAEDGILRMVRAYSDFIQGSGMIDPSLQEAALQEVLDLLPRTGPCLGSADIGDNLVIKDGPNKGAYVIASKYELSLDMTIAGSGLGLALLPFLTDGWDYLHLRELLTGIAAYGPGEYEGEIGADLYKVMSSDILDVVEIHTLLEKGLDQFTPILKLVAVGIQGQFPVDPLRPICELFNRGFPDIPALPEPPDFDIDCVAYDSYDQEVKDPFDIIVEFIKFFFDFLATLGFDVPDELDLNASSVVAGIINNVRTRYAVGPGTCYGTLRVYFTEPTTFEADGGARCVTFHDPTLGIIINDDKTITVDPTVVQSVVLPSTNPTLFSTTVGAEEVLYAAAVDAVFQLVPSIVPGTTETDASDYPRDLAVGAPITAGSDVFTRLRLTDGGRAAPLAMGIQQYRDQIEIHEEVYLAKALIPPMTDTVRTLAITTTLGSSVVHLLPSVMPPAVVGTNPSNTEFDLRTMLEPKDILFIDEGLSSGGYRVVAVNARSLELDRPFVDNTAPIVKSGNTGSYDLVNPSRFTAIAGGVGAFTSNDLGRYLTVYGSHYPASNGSYEILSVDTLGTYVELSMPSGAFLIAEANVLWAVVDAPVTAPATVAAGGTKLVGLRPIRAYKWNHVTFSVVAVDNSLDATTAEFTVYSPDSPTTFPQAGTDQPYRITRPGIQRISSTQMAQNRDGAYYYFDVSVRALGVTEEFNVPVDQRFDVVFGTYYSEGYRYEVENTDFTFSPNEDVRVVFSSKFLPEGRDDTQSARVPVEGQGLQAKYSHSSLVNQVDRFLVSRAERTVCANPIARHFLPSYLSFDVRYTGGDAPSTIVESLDTQIRLLQPKDPLSVAAVIEKTLHNHGVADWEHDVVVTTVTHDLNRRLVGNRSRDRLGGTAPQYFNGSNRTSYFIPGANKSSDVVSSESDIGPGERTRLVRLTGTIDLSQ